MNKKIIIVAAVLSIGAFSACDPIDNFDSDDAQAVSEVTHSPGYEMEFARLTDVWNTLNAVDQFSTCTEWDAMPFYWTMKEIEIGAEREVNEEAVMDFFIGVC